METLGRIAASHKPALEPVRAAAPVAVAEGERAVAGLPSRAAGDSPVKEGRGSAGVDPRSWTGGSERACLLDELGSDPAAVGLLSNS